MPESDQLKLTCQLVSGWPKLAWVAVLERGADSVHVRHGSHVELGDGWCVEAVWAGDFEHADFDRAELLFGSGIRCRSGQVVFVSTSTMLDRLWHCRRGQRIYVANSLPALLACAEISLLDDYHHYAADIATLTKGLNDYKRIIPASPCDVSVAYYQNLEYDGESLREVDKPDTTPAFTCYADYHGFLVDVARRLGANLSSLSRRHRIVPFASVSSGYDSGAAAAIAREAGCTETVSIVNASSLLPRSDSGLEIATHLGLACRGYHHSQTAYRHEETIWSAAGMPAGLNLTMFDYPDPLCLFFTGYRGDTVWDSHVSNDSAPLSGPTIAGLSLCEFRLTQGLFHCPVPCWGSLKVRQIQTVSLMPEMALWRLNHEYDRPIPRRILEEASVPRELFGMRKEVTTVDCGFIWPFSVVGMRKFSRYVRERGYLAPSPPAVWLLRKTAHLAMLAYSNTPRKLRSKFRDPRTLLSFRGQSLLFQWANHELRNVYEAPLASIVNEHRTKGAQT